MNSRWVRLLGAATLSLCLAIACTPPTETEQRLSVTARLSDDSAGYQRITTPRTLRFPGDHGPHPGYKHEWWYLTGQVTTGNQRRFGFQFTVFRESISPGQIESPSKWATNQLYLAHAAVTDVDGNRYFSDERFARGALGLAGAAAAPFRVWLEDWWLSGQTGKAGSLAGRVRAQSGRFGFDLAISHTGPPVPHGDGGMSVKGSADNASYYYSYTRLKVDGTIRVADDSFHATGEAWFDHEWSSSALSASQSGWDWFSLQLSSGAELMVFRLRDKSDPERDFYSGTFVPRYGEPIGLESGAIRMEVLDHWTSDRTGIRYPRSWRVAVPDLGLALTIEPWIDDQEFVHSFRYWEGASRITGKHGGEPVRGQGYVELAGYAPGQRR